MEYNEVTNVTAAVEECEMSSETAYFWFRQTIDAGNSISEPEGKPPHSVKHTGIVVYLAELLYIYTYFRK